MKNRDIYWRRYKKNHTQDNDTLVPFKVDTLGPHIVLPITIGCPVVSSWISLMVWNLLLFKVILVLGKAGRHRVPNLGCRGVESLANVIFHKKLHKMWCMSGHTVMMKLPNHQLPISCGLLKHPNSFHGGMFKFNTKFDADCCSTCSFWMWRPHCTYVHSKVSTALTD